MELFNVPYHMLEEATGNVEEAYVLADNAIRCRADEIAEQCQTH